jgi:hypothetical protein
MYPTEEQQEMLLRHCSDSRMIWNLACEQHMFARKYGRRLNARTAWPSQKEQSRQLTEMRAAEPYVAMGTTTVQQAALRDFDRALKNHFTNPGHFGWPAFRSAKRGNQGFVVRDVRVAKVNRKWSTVQVPKIGAVRLKAAT